MRGQLDSWNYKELPVRNVRRKKLSCPGRNLFPCLQDMLDGLSWLHGGTVFVHVVKWGLA
jgi:hypothetical protein